uniref:BEN domain-containing protein 7 isoform X2 n=1 Tax=Myxine glutinosa TaxID=7769 RepID=UPI00358F247C
MDEGARKRKRKSQSWKLHKNEDFLCTDEEASDQEFVCKRPKEEDEALEEQPLDLVYATAAENGWEETSDCEPQDATLNEDPLASSHDSEGVCLAGPPVADIKTELDDQCWCSDIPAEIGCGAPLESPVPTFVWEPKECDEEQHSWSPAPNNMEGAGPAVPAPQASATRCSCTCTPLLESILAELRVVRELMELHTVSQESLDNRPARHTSTCNPPPPNPGSAPPSLIMRPSLPSTNGIATTLPQPQFPRGVTNGFRYAVPSHVHPTPSFRPPRGGRGSLGATCHPQSLYGFSEPATTLVTTHQPQASVTTLERLGRGRGFDTDHKGPLASKYGPGLEYGYNDGIAARAAPTETKATPVALPSSGRPLLPRIEYVTCGSKISEPSSSRNQVSAPNTATGSSAHHHHGSYYALGHTNGDEPAVQLAEGYSVFIATSQLEEILVHYTRSGSLLFRKLVAAFFDDRTLANSLPNGKRKRGLDDPRKGLEPQIVAAIRAFTEEYCKRKKIKLPGPKDWVQLLQDQIKLARRRMKRATLVVTTRWENSGSSL